MQKPDFSAVVRHSVQRDSHLKAGLPQAIPYGTRIYRCECCNDSGIVQSWKLNRWALGPDDQPLNSSTSLPVFCQHFTSCGNQTQQVFAGSRDNDEAAERTAEVNLFKGNEAGESQVRGRIAAGALRCLSQEQSKYIHNKVLEYREMLACTERGRQYVEEVKEACRGATPNYDAPRNAGPGRLVHIGELLCPPVIPAEPDWGAPQAAQRVEVTDPRDFPTPAVDSPAPTQPVSVTDDPVDPRGITVYTNADDPDLWF
jgi:hypothetical protein